MKKTFSDIFMVPGRDVQRGATTVEYVVIIIVIIITLIGTILLLVNPTDDNSLLPKTYKSVSNKVSNFGTTNIVNN